MARAPMTIATLPPQQPPLGPHRFFFRSARRRRRERWVTVGICVVVIVGFCALSVLSLEVRLKGLSSFPFGPNFASNLTNALSQTAAGAAAVADGDAKAQGIPDGALTVAALNQERPSLIWVAGNVPLPANSDGTLTSVDVGGDHVLAAQRPNSGSLLPFCVLGLTVSSSTDPIIGQDHLSGTGDYWATIGLATSSETTCSADSAPDSRWKRANPEELQGLVQAHSVPSP